MAQLTPSLSGDERMATLPVGVPLEDLAYFFSAKNNASSLIASSWFGGGLCRCFGTCCFGRSGKFTTIPTSGVEAQPARVRRAQRSNFLFV